MNKFLVAGASLASLALVTGTPAKAADMTIKAAPPPPVVTWAGGYLGFGVGGEWARDTWTTNCFYQTIAQFCLNPTLAAGGTGTIFALDASNAHRFNPSSFRGEIFAGYRWSFGGPWVLGAEIRGGLADGKQTFNGIPGCANTGGATCQTGTVGIAGAVLGLDRTQVRLLADGAFLTRVGFAVWPELLIYGAAGFALQEIKTNQQCAGGGTLCFIAAGNLQVANADNHSVLPGWTVAGGVDWRIFPHWFLRADYRYASFKNVTSNNIFCSSFAGVGATCPLLNATTGVLGNVGTNFTQKLNVQYATVAVGFDFYSEPAPALVKARY